MRSLVEFGNVVKAVMHCITVLKCKVTRAVVMGLLKLEQFGGVGGDPENVGQMIDRILVGLVVDDFLSKEPPVIPDIPLVMTALRLQQFGNGTLTDIKRVEKILPDVLARRSIPATAVTGSSNQEEAPSLPTALDSSLEQVAQDIQDSLTQYRGRLCKEVADIISEIHRSAEAMAANIRSEAEATNSANQAEADDALAALCACNERIQLLEAEKDAAKHEAAEATGKVAMLQGDAEVKSVRISLLEAQVVLERSRADKLEASIESADKNMTAAKATIEELRAELVAERSRSDRAEGELAAHKAMPGRDGANKPSQRRGNACKKQ